MPFFPFLSKLVPQTWLLYLIGSLAILSAGIYCGWTVSNWRSSSVIAACQTETHGVREEFSAYKLQVAVETSKANQETVSKLQLAQQLLDRAQTQIQNKSRALAEASTRLTKVLNEATQTNDLSPSSVEYFRSLRSLQTGNTDTVHP